MDVIYIKPIAGHNSSDRHLGESGECRDGYQRDCLRASVTFSEAINPATVNSNTFQLFGPGNTLVTGSVSYSSASNMATFLPAAALATSTSYTAVVTGGSGGVKDLTGNAMTGNFTWSFTTAATLPPPGGCPCNIWAHRPSLLKSIVAIQARPNLA